MQLSGSVTMKGESPMFHNYELFTREWNDLLSLGIDRSYRSGDIIYLQGNKDIGLVCIQKGSVKNSSYLSNGAEKMICILDAPAIIGETAVIDEGENSLTAQALTYVEAVIVSTNAAKQYMRENSNVMMMMLGIYAEKIRGVQLQAESVALNLQQKLARMLVNYHSYGMFSNAPSDGQLKITHEQLAGFLGTTRPKITNALCQFEKSELIIKKRGRIIIVDYNGLKAIYE